VLVITNFDVLVLTRIFLEGSKWTRIGIMVKAFFKVLKLLVALSIYIKGPDFRPFSISFKRSIKAIVT
jgi:hypothetical protein